MIYRIICLFLFLALFQNGVAQTIKNTQKTESVDALLHCVEFIESNQIELAEKSIRKQIDNQESIRENVKFCYSIAIAYNNKLLYNMSMEYALEGLKLLDTSSYLLTELNHVIIINHLDLKNYDLAESHYWKTSKIGKKKKSVLANEYNLIGEIYRLKGEVNKSIPFYHKAIKLNLANSDNEDLAFNYNNIGLSHLYSNNIDSAVYYLDLSSKLISDLKLTNLESAINISYGELYLKKQNYSKALNFFKKTISFDLSHHPDKYEVYRDAYKGMKDCYEQIGDYKNAFHSYTKYQEYKTRILDNKKNTLILQSQILTERAMHDKEISLINSKLELEIKYKRIMYVVIASILFIIILIIYILKIRNNSIKEKVELEINKNRVQELEIDKMKFSQERLESELIQTKQSQEIKKLERIRLEEQIQSNNRELASTAIHLMSKNEILNQIQDKLNQVKSENNDDALKTYQEIKFLISDSLRLDEDWQVFKKHFTDVHPHFFEKLKTEYPEITTDELKLCAYLKIQLSSKEIARLIYITAAAVNKRRNRLRKKLNISESVDFYEFFLKK